MLRQRSLVLAGSLVTAAGAATLATAVRASSAQADDPVSTTILGPGPQDTLPGQVAEHASDPTPLKEWPIDPQAPFPAPTIGP